MEAWAGIEPAIELLQSSALPLGYHAFCVCRQRGNERRQRFAMCDAVSSRISVNRINAEWFFDIDSSIHWFIGRNKPLNGLTLIEYLEVSFDRHFEIRQGPAGQNDDFGALNRL